MSSSSIKRFFNNNDFDVKKALDQSDSNIKKAAYFIKNLFYKIFTIGRKGSLYDARTSRRFEEAYFALIAMNDNLPDSYQDFFTLEYYARGKQLYIDKSKGYEISLEKGFNGHKPKIVLYEGIPSTDYQGNPVINRQSTSILFEINSEADFDYLKKSLKDELKLVENIYQHPAYKGYRANIDRLINNYTKIQNKLKPFVESYTRMAQFELNGKLINSFDIISDVDGGNYREGQQKICKDINKSNIGFDLDKDSNNLIVFNKDEPSDKTKTISLNNGKSSKLDVKKEIEEYFESNPDSNMHEFLMQDSPITESQTYKQLIKEFDNMVEQYEPVDAQVLKEKLELEIQKINSVK